MAIRVKSIKSDNDNNCNDNTINNNILMIKIIIKLGLRIINNNNTYSEVCTMVKTEYKCSNKVIHIYLKRGNVKKVIFF